MQAADAVKDEHEPVLVLLGDALVAGEAPSAGMVAISRTFGGASVVGLEEVPLERVSRYGIAAASGIDGLKAIDGLSGLMDLGRIVKIEDLVEKPAPGKAPSRLAIAGRYLLDPEIFPLLASQTPGVGGEIQLTDAIRRLLAEKPVCGCAYSGKRQDIGSPKGYFEALKAMGENE